MSSSIVSRTARRAFQLCASSKSPIGRPAVAYKENSPLPSISSSVSNPRCRFDKSFSTTARRLKKKGKNNEAFARSDSSPPVDKAHQKTTPVDEAFDASELEARILKSMERLTHELSLLRQGGKLNPDLLEKLTVRIGKGEKETVKLRDIAQIIPRGRFMNVTVGEEDFVKPVSTAIMASPYSLNPDSPKPDNPLTIPVPIPPPTGESRRQAVENARKLAHEAEASIQVARQGHHKKLRKLEVDKQIRPDDLRKANKEMEDIVQKGKSDIKRILDGAIKVLDSH